MRETHVPGRPCRRGDHAGDARAGATHGSHTGTGTVRPPPTDSRGGESDARSGLWTRSSLRKEPGEEKSEGACSRRPTLALMASNRLDESR